MIEQNIMKSIMLAVGKHLPAMRIFRNNTGTGWQGTRLQSRAGTVLLENPRPLEAGLCKGSADLIGWETVEITPDMVGQKLAVFVAVEVKQPGNKPTPEQVVFLQNVSKAGGIAIVATSPEQFINLRKFSLANTTNESK